jgi:hypothetical protein
VVPLCATVKTSSGATAVQIVWSSRRGSRQQTSTGTALARRTLAAEFRNAVSLSVLKQPAVARMCPITRHVYDNEPFAILAPTKRCVRHADSWLLCSAHVRSDATE